MYKLGSEYNYSSSVGNPNTPTTPLLTFFFFRKSEKVFDPPPRTPLPVCLLVLHFFWKKKKNLWTPPININVLECYLLKINIANIKIARSSFDNKKNILWPRERTLGNKFKRFEVWSSFPVLWVEEPQPMLVGEGSESIMYCKNCTL